MHVQFPCTTCPTLVGEQPYSRAITQKLAYYKSFEASTVQYQLASYFIKNMKGLMFLLFLSLPELYFAAIADLEDTVYWEDITTNSRQFVSLGGLFSITSKNRDNVCRWLNTPSVEYVEAMVFTIDKINRDSSLLPGVNLTFNIRDTCSTPNVALEKALEFVYMYTNDVSCTNQTALPVSGIVGASMSSSSDLVARMLRLFRLPQISHASTAAAFSDTSQYDYFFRTIPSDSFQARAMADLIVHFNWTYVHVLYSEDTYGREGIKSLVKALNDSQKCIAIRKALPRTLLGSRQTYNDIVVSMSQEWVKNASVAVLFGHPYQAIEIMRAINGVIDNINRSILENTVWIASDSWSKQSKNFPIEYRKRVKGMLGIQPIPSSREDFIEHFISLKPNKTRNPWFNYYWKVVFKCIHEPCNVSAQSLSTVRGSYAPYVIDAIYAYAYAIHQMVVDCCPSETLCDAIVSRRSVGETINGTLLREYLSNVSFKRTFTDEKLFDANGDVEGTYEIVNLQFINNEYSLETVGTWDNIDFINLTSPIQWPDGGEEPPPSICSLPCEVGYEEHQVPGRESCCWECRVCLGESSVSSGEECYECEENQMPNLERSGCVDIPLTYFTASSPWAIVILILTCAGIAATIFVAVMFAVFRKNKVIKATNRELSAILLAGIFMCYILPFFFIMKPSPILCGVRSFLIGSCFAVSYSALLARSNRMHRIFNHPLTKGSDPPRFVGPVSQVVITFLLISVQVVIGVVWLAVEPPSVETVRTNARTLELHCGASPYFGIPISLSYNLFLLIFSTYFAFHTRNVMDNFNEAKFINVTLYTLCIILLGLIPAYFISINFGTVYASFILLLAIILSASTTLLCLLATKVFIVFLNISKKKNSNTTIENATSVVIL